MRKRALFIIQAIFFSLSMFAAGSLADADTLYAKGEFSQALAIYESIEKEYGTSSELLFNEGQCYMRAGNLGQAMLRYQRALELNPGNKEARENIKYLENKVQEANKAEMRGKKLSAAPENLTFFGTIKNYIVKGHLSDTWGWWAGSLFLVFTICLALYIFTADVLIRKIGFFGGWIALGLSLIFLVFALMGARASSRHDRGVVLGYKVQLLSEPSAESKTTGMPLTQGTVANILERKEKNWYKIRLNSDYVGWIKSTDFEEI